jgi:hypothetical protein
MHNATPATSMNSPRSFTAVTMAIEAAAAASSLLYGSAAHAQSHAATSRADAGAQKHAAQAHVQLARVSPA